MSRRRNILIVLLGLLWSGRVAAQFMEEPPPLRVDAGFVSSRVFRGVERAGSSAQASIELNRGAFRGGAWLNQAFGAGDPDEFNLNAGYAWQSSGGFNVGATVGHTWFRDVPGVDRSFEGGLVFGLGPAGGFTPSLAYHRDFRFEADTVEVSFARSVALTKLGAFLELNFRAGLVHGNDWRPDTAGPRLEDGYGYWGGEARLPYRIGPHSTVVAGVHYAGNSGRSIPNGAFGRGGEGKLWVSLGVNLDF